MMGNRFKSIKGIFMDSKRRSCPCCVFDASIDRAWEKREAQREIEEQLSGGEPG